LKRNGAERELGFLFIDEAKLLLGLTETSPKLIIEIELYLGSFFGIELKLIFLLCIQGSFNPLDASKNVRSQALA
jgi:hypothetical protein